MTYGSAHYWASEDLNTTGENVGITLDSMCDIIAANDVTNGNAVVFVPGDIEHGQKGHFALGEGGGGGANIDASAYQVVIGDGEGNGVGAQGGVEAQEANKIYLKDKRLGPNIATCEDDGTPIQDVDTGSFTIASNGLGHTHTEIEYDETLDANVEVQVEDDGWKATIEDLAKVLATGKSKVEIGELGESYSSAFWNDTLEGPDIKIKGAAKIEMLPREDSYTPVISMRGNSLIDISNEKNFDYNWDMGWQAGRLSNYTEDIRSISPFTNKTDGPLLQLKGSPTVMFHDQSVVKVNNGSFVEIGGNARVHIVGGQWMNGYSSSLEPNKVNISAGPGFWSELYGNSNFYSVLNMNPGTLLLTTQLRKQDIPSYGPSSISNFDYVFYGGNSTFRDTYTPGSSFYSGDWNVFHLSRLSSESNVTNNTSAPRYDNVRLRSVLASPTFSMSNATLLTISAYNNSAVAIGIGAAEGGTINADLTTNGNINIKAGLREQSQFVLDWGSDIGANAATKVNYSGKSRMNFNIGDNTSINWNPTGPMGFYCNARHTEMNWEWKKLYAIFGGNDVFAQVDGNSHFESWSGTVILRNSNNLRAYNGSDSQRHSLYPYFPSPTKNRSQRGSIKVDADLSEMTIADIENTYASQLKSATALPPSENAMTWTGFSGTSKTKVPVVYCERLSVSSCSCVGDIKSITLAGEYETWDEIYNSEEFRKLAIQRLKCINTPTFGSVSGGVIERTFRYSDGHISYSGVLPVNITNITVGFDSYNQTGIDQAKSDYKVASNGSYPGSIEMRSGLVSAGNITSPFNVAFSLSGYTPSYSIVSKYKYTETITLNNLTYNQDGGEYDNGKYVRVSNYINLNNTTPTQFLANPQVLEQLRSIYGNFTSVEPMENVVITYDQYRYSRYVYYVNHIILHYDTWDLSNSFYGNSTTDGAILNYPTNVTVDELPAYQQFEIKSKIGTSDTTPSYGYWDLSNAQFSDNYAVAEDVKYEISTTSNYTGNTETHLGKNWYGPIQTADRIGDKDWDRSPIIQAYGPVNICVREKYSPGLEYNTTITTSENEFDLTDMNQAIRDFVASSHYQELLDYISNNYSGKELYYINRINPTASSSQYVVYFFLKEDDWDLEVASTTNVPVVDVTEGSELRIYGGAKIKAVTKYGETTYEFSSADSDEDPVSFTLTELKALKQLLNNI